VVGERRSTASKNEWNSSAIIQLKLIRLIRKSTCIQLPILMIKASGIGLTGIHSPSDLRPICSPPTSSWDKTVKAPPSLCLPTPRARWGAGQGG